MSHIHSKDPRKRYIVAALKRKTGATKVTLVMECEPGIFSGNCMARQRGVSLFTCLGVYRVALHECEFPANIESVGF